MMVYLYLAISIVGAVVLALLIVWLATRDIDREFYRTIERWVDSWSEEEWQEFTKDCRERTA